MTAQITNTTFTPTGNTHVEVGPTHVNFKNLVLHPLDFEGLYRCANTHFNGNIDNLINTLLIDTVTPGRCKNYRQSIPFELLKNLYKQPSTQINCTIDRSTWDLFVDKVESDIDLAVTSILDCVMKLILPDHDSSAAIARMIFNDLSSPDKRQFDSGMTPA